MIYYTTTIIKVLNYTNNYYCFFIYMFIDTNKINLFFLCFLVFDF